MEKSELNDYQKFKHLLEYFVSHLEYVVNEDTKFVGYDTYIKPFVGKRDFRRQGQGYNGDNIQNQIKEWSSYSNNYSILININAASQKPYQNNACYLNWVNTWVNVRPRWDDDHIVKLYLTQEEKSSANPVNAKTIKELGLFDKETPNKTLNDFFDNYKNMLDNYISKQKEQNMNEKIQEYVNLITSNHNLILTGAPGTGKTYLAKQIAQQMIFGEIKKSMTDEEERQFNEQCGFVQFHPSYDYTDFVEGLRPKQDDNGNVGFERKDGAFKEFCKKAIASQRENSVDNFNEVWDKLVDSLNQNDFIDVPFISNKNKTFRVELNEYGTGLANRTYKNDDYQKGEWIKGQSKFFSKEQLYNIYRGMPGIPSGGHDNYRKAVVNHMKDKLGLKDYQAGTINKEKVPYIFIIDEINRGEISKVFGELFFSIDPGYRGITGKVKTQYQNLISEGDDFYDGFYIPENVYIIGTMNDIDRSVESMDFAFRRRFAFKAVSAEESKDMLKSDEAWGYDEQMKPKTPTKEIIESIIGNKEKNVIGKMDAINNLIWHKPTNEEKDEDKSIEGLSSAYHIGASYFLKLANYRNANGEYDQESFDKLWEYHLEGLLFEYLRGTPEIYKEIKKLAQAYGYTKADKYE